MSARPPRENRKERSARRRREAELQRSARQSVATESTDSAGLPVSSDVSGMAAAGTYWNPMRVAQPAHRATSPNLAGAVPFVADADLGHAGPVLGINATTGGLWHFDPWELYASKQINSTNVLVIGEFGTGKSGTVKQLCWRSIVFGRQVVVPSDSKGEWVGVAEAAGGQVIRLGGKHTTARLNPLDRGPRSADASDDEHEVMVASRRRAVLVSLVQATLPADQLLTPAEHTAVEFALARTIEQTDDRPTLRGVYENIKNPDSSHPGYLPDLEQDGARARHVLRRFCEGDLAGLFEDESTITLDDDAPMVVVDTSALFARGELAATCAQICTTNWIQAVISNKASKRTRFLVREEGWRDMTSIAALQAFRQWLKLSRDYGISVVTLMHKVSDFDAVGGEGSEARALAYSIFADISNKFIFQQAAAEQPRLIKDLGLPPSHARMVMDLPQGMFLARLSARRAFVIDAFATSVEVERQLFSTDAAMLATAADRDNAAALVVDVASEISVAIQEVGDDVALEAQEAELPAQPEPELQVEAEPVWWPKPVPIRSRSAGVRLPRETGVDDGGEHDRAVNGSVAYEPVAREAIAVGQVASAEDEVPHHTITRHGLLRLVRHEQDDALEERSPELVRTCRRCLHPPAETDKFCTQCGVPISEWAQA